VERLKIHFKRLDALGVNYRPLKERWNVGRWTPGATAEVYRVMEWDLTRWIDKPGRFEVTFQYTRGAHRLEIEWVELVSRGCAVARDAHPGFTGTSTSRNVYALDVEAIEKGAAYTLVASVRSDGGSDSSGTIYLERKAR
jgi:hexosaminidase